MPAIFGFLAFAAALAASLGVFWFTLVPALPRIVALLRDGVDPRFVPARVVLVSEQRLRAQVATVASARPAWREAA